MKGYVLCWLCQGCQAKRAEEGRRVEMSAYATRDLLLKRMGYASYAEYLKSERWARIRLRLLKLRNFMCELCGARANHVHHNRYQLDVLRGQSLKGLKALCADCHERVEFDAGRKVGVNEASHRFYGFLGGK